MYFVLLWCVFHSSYTRQRPVVRSSRQRLVAPALLLVVAGTAPLCDCRRSATGYVFGRLRFDSDCRCGRVVLGGVHSEARHNLPVVS